LIRHGCAAQCRLAHGQLSGGSLLLVLLATNLPFYSYNPPDMRALQANFDLVRGWLARWFPC